jgi:hypothetical protein
MYASGTIPNLRLVKDSGIQFLLSFGIVEGDVVDETVFNELEAQDHLFPVPGSISGASLELPRHLRRPHVKGSHGLNVTNRSHANRLGWRHDTTGVRRRGQAKAKELAFAECSQELYIRVYSSDSDSMVTYHLLESAVPILLEQRIMVGDQINLELLDVLIGFGHLYTESSGQTGY